MSMLLATKCWGCGGLIDVLNPTPGQMLECPECQAIFVVTATDPLELSQAVDPDEDAWFEEDFYASPRTKR